MSEKGHWEGIPGVWYDDAASPDGRRFVSSPHGWTLIRQRLAELARNKCEGGGCTSLHLPFPYNQGHHVKKRGMGGGNRDDRIVVCGERQILSLCLVCHDRAERGVKVVASKHIGSDVCVCGDYRSQHVDEVGACRVCGSSPRPYDGCRVFRLSRRSNFEEHRNWVSTQPEAVQS